MDSENQMSKTVLTGGGSTQVKLEGGPLDGKVVAFPFKYNNLPPFLEFAAYESMDFRELPKEEEGDSRPNLRKIRYKLWDNWPPRYLYEGEVDRW